MVDLTEMTADDFAQFHGQEFIITSTDPQILLDLVEVKKLGSRECNDVGDAVFTEPVF